MNSVEKMQDYCGFG